MMPAARKGHFVLESGLHADTWLDLDAWIVEPRALRPRIEALAALLLPFEPTALCGPLVGGAFVARVLAEAMGLRFYFTERVGSTASDRLFAAVYRLPGGIRERASSERFAVVDDIVSAGSSVRATLRELADARAAVCAVGALMVLGDRAVGHFEALGIPLVAPSFEPFESWEPARCPQCARGIALTGVDPMP